MHYLYVETSVNAVIASIVLSASHFVKCLLLPSPCVVVLVTVCSMLHDKDIVPSNLHKRRNTEDHD